MNERLKLVDGQLSIDLLGDWGYSSEKLGGDVCLGPLSRKSLVACLMFFCVLPKVLGLMARMINRYIHGPTSDRRHHSLKDHEH